MTAPALADRHRTAADVAALRAPRAIEPEKGTEPVSDTPEASVATRLALVEGSLRFAKGLAGGAALAVIAGTINLIVTVTRVEERYDRLARDVALSTTQAATAKETSDRLSERLAAMSERVERIDRALSTSLPSIQSSLEGLRLELAEHPSPRASRP